MLKIGDKIINVPILSILEELRESLILAGIDKLKDLKKRGDNARITCPCHKDGKERNPSCSVLLYQKSEDLLPGFVSCFTCGYKASLPQLVADCFDKNLDWAEKWLLERFDYSHVEGSSRTELFLFALKLNKEPEKIEQKEYISEDVLQLLRHYHPYMWQRKLTPEIVEKFDIGYNKDKDAISFPVYDDKGCLFVIYRFVRPWGNIRFEIPENITKEIFGLNHITPEMGKVVICEAVFDALTCWKYGIPAIALFGTGTDEQINTLKHHPTIRHFVLGLDPDNAGRKGTKKLRAALSKHKLITEYKYKDTRDINDLDSEVLNLEEI